MERHAARKESCYCVRCGHLYISRSPLLLRMRENTLYTLALCGQRRERIVYTITGNSVFLFIFSCIAYSSLFFFCRRCPQRASPANASVSPLPPSIHLPLSSSALLTRPLPPRRYSNPEPLIRCRHDATGLLKLYDPPTTVN